MAQERVLAIDIGGTKTLLAIISPKGVERSLRIETPQSEFERVIGEAVSELLESAGIVKVRRAGVSAPGPLDAGRGVLMNPPNIVQKVIDLAGALRRFTDELIVANDAVASLWAEVAVNPSIRNAVMVTIGTGIGGGVMVDGKLLAGRQGDAHEIGHIVVDHDYPHPCGCGGRGHWEAIAGGRWVARTSKYLAGKEQGLDTVARKQALAGRLDAASLFRLYGEGDPFARKVVEYLARVHAAGIASIVSTYDPEVVFLAGGLYLKNREHLLPHIQRFLGSFLWKKQGPELRDASYGELQGLWGAYYLATLPPPCHPVIRL